MIRLLHIEWQKLKHYRPFWILIVMYSLCVAAVCSSVMFLMAYIKSKGGDFDGIDPTIIPFYDYPDVWQNISYLASFFKVILAFIVIISISNESTYRTLRQNIIDGLSIGDFLKSKMLFIFSLSLASTVLLFIIGLVTASIYSHVQGFSYIFQSTQFLLAYFLVLITYLSFAMLIALILPRAGFVIVGLLMYTLIFEPLLAVFLQNFPHIYEWLRPTARYFPVMSVYYLIPVPFPRYALMEIQDYVSIKETLIVVGWLIFNVGMSYFVLQKKDW